jgi:hypothetical protein
MTINRCCNVIFNVCNDDGDDIINDGDCGGDRCGDVIDDV